MMLKIFEMPYTPYGESPWSEPIYAALFSIAIIILCVAYYRNKENELMETSSMEEGIDVQQFDVLGQPVRTTDHNQFPKEGVLFNTGGKTKVFQNFFTVVGAFIIFGLIVSIFQ